VSRPVPDARGRLLGAAAAVTAGIAAVTALVVAPPDRVQGQAQRLMYVHVPAAWLAYLCFASVLVCSVGYLVRRDLRWDRRAQAAAELGVGMTALAIALGSLWGRPVWGAWWVWDPRLVTTAVLLLVYLGYLSVRGLSDDRAAGARRAAAVGIVGFIDVPVVHF
jgi:heme exporter protein C